MPTRAPRFVILCLLGLWIGTASAEDKPNPDQLKRAYDDALVQLKTAQNSKNELARENEKLAKQVDDLKKQLAGARSQIEHLTRQISDNDRKTFQLRACQSAWQNFLRAYPELLARWNAFLADDALTQPEEQSTGLEFTVPLFTD